MWSFGGTIGGLVLVIFGVGCSVIALVRQGRAHGRALFREALDGARLAIRSRYFRVMPWRRRDVVLHDLAGATRAGSSASGELTVTGPAIPSDVDDDERFRLLVTRIANVERQVLQERAARSEQARELRNQIKSLDNQHTDG